MSEICSNCLNIGKPKYTPKDGLKLPIAGFFLGITFYWIPLDLFSSFAVNFDSLSLLSGPIISILIGGFLFISYFKKQSNICPKCGYGHMIKIDTPDARNLVEKYNLTHP